MGESVRVRQGVREATVNRVPRWRIGAAAAVLGALALFLLAFAPVYIRNFELQSFVATIPRRIESQTQSGAAPSDDLLRSWFWTMPGASIFR